MQLSNSKSLTEVFSFATLLYEHGLAIGPFLPWHNSSDPYHWVVAESLVRLTTRVAVKRVFERLIVTFPDWASLSNASEQEIAVAIAGVGLQNQRAKQLKQLATIVLSNNGLIPRTRAELMKLPGIGMYTADAILLHVFNEKDLPIDSNLQRVFRRFYGLPLPQKTRRSNPYKDEGLIDVVTQIVKKHNARELHYIHLGVLDIAWEYCKYEPDQKPCPIKEICLFASKN